MGRGQEKKMNSRLATAYKVKDAGKGLKPKERCARYSHFPEIMYTHLISISRKLRTTINTVSS
jgi:hypothetical protein